ncbi:MAG TPA: ectoine/hydroxyectoine ABC transporter permease subunit EhuC [Streptosporangiaceae bacterium]|jgi:polar amino acid transport system permease protein
MATINPCSSDLPGTLGNAMPFICKGAVVTAQVTVGGAVLAIVLAFVAGLAATSHLRIIRAVARVYMEFFRGASVLVQLFWIFYAMPALTGYRLSATFAGVLTLGLNLGAYGSEVVRGAIQAVPKPQREAAVALNLSTYQRMRRVILPQALVGMVPPGTSLLIELLKATSLVSAISVADMTYQANVTVSSIGHQFTIFGIVMVIYFLMAQVITAIMRVVERRAAATVGREPPKRRKAQLAWTDPAAGGGEL